MNQNKQFGSPVFVPGICCEHAWDGGTRTRCEECGATCVRDANGVIVEYDAEGGAGRDYSPPSGRETRDILDRPLDSRELLLGGDLG